MGLFCYLRQGVLAALMGGFTQDTASSTAKRINAPYGFKLVPMFSAVGTTDTIPDLEVIHSVERSKP